MLFGSYCKSKKSLPLLATRNWIRTVLGLKDQMEYSTNYGAGIQIYILSCFLAEIKKDFFFKKHSEGWATSLFTKD